MLFCWKYVGTIMGQCCGSGMFYPGSGSKNFIPDLGSWILNPGLGYWILYLGSRILRPKKKRGGSSKRERLFSCYLRFHE
jgi:hypothetical protein